MSFQWKFEGYSNRLLEQLARFCTVVGSMLSLYISDLETVDSEP
ncbi:hypothetical protein DM48_7158 [Burkholderia gladioli]|uniref:Uncharacterized protein n=1 Tax=Burkholderia gladioli TaxID=28095 RepID=A0AAW3ES93_BURGA|nr:hypothetical protein DM48_7158 [Burkholderia gladioli]